METTIDARWGIDSIVPSMKAVHFEAYGFNRTYWDFAVGFGLFVPVFLLFAAIVAWQLGSLPQETLGRMTLLTWTFTICLVGIAFLGWKYFFLAPFIFSGVSPWVCCWPLGFRHGWTSAAPEDENWQPQAGQCRGS